MADPAVSFDAIIQEARKKRQHEKLAQEIFGKNRRSSAPLNGPKVGLGASLASRIGVNKRNSSVPRSSTPRQPREPAQPRLAVPYTRPSNINRPKPSHTQSTSDIIGNAANVGYAGDEVTNGGDDLIIRGAAAVPYIVVAQNFAPGTTAADIESVMASVGGQMTNCKLVASSPTVIAEMTFVEKAGGEKVIETFNGKKADGRPLYVYWKIDGAASKANRRQPAEPEPPAPTPAADEDAVMELDENAESRAAENRLREERRGKDERVPRDVFPTGPRGSGPGGYMDSYPDRRPRRDEWNRVDGRYGFSDRGGYRDGGRGRYVRDEGRGFRGGQSWRP